MNTHAKVLIVEDDDAIRGLLIAALNREAVAVDAAVNGREAIELCASCEYALILLDLMMPEMNGFQFLEEFTKAFPSARSIVFVNTAYDERIVSDLPAHRVHGIVRKPFDVPQLAAVIAAVAQTWSAQTRRQTYERPLTDQALGAAPACD